MPLPKKIPRSRSKAKEAEDKRILVNRYRVDRKLGTGNFGTAFLVTDLKCKDDKEKLKVLKEIPVGDLQPDETVDAMHEAKLLRDLNHPGVVKFVNSFIDSEFFCIVTEYCEGGDLDMKINQYKKQKKNIPEPKIWEWIIQLLLAVQYIHSRRVMHRDIKSRNIFLKDDRIKLGDFGISRILMGTTDMASTFTGTPYYMSPEVLKHEGYNSKSDVWSVGCILYDMVSLQHAFEGQSLMGVMYKIVEGTLPPWPSNYSKELKEVFEAMLEKDPHKRPSASDVLKMPFIAQQMELITNTLMDKHMSRDTSELASKESKALAAALKEKSHLSKLKEDSEKMKWKNLSPRERMRILKMKKADEERERLNAIVTQKFKDTRSKYNENRKSQNAYQTHIGREIWSRGNKKEGSGDAGTTADDTDSDGTLLAEDPYAQFEGARDEDSDDDDDIVYSNLTVPDRPHASPYDSQARRPYLTVAADERPITPLRDTMVYDVNNSSLDFKDGIPDTPDLAETYYSQFDFEEGGSDDEEIEDEDDEAEGTLVPEVEDLISHMQNALHKTEQIQNATLTDDELTGAFGPVARDSKIKNLKSECIKKLGEKGFTKAYEFLRKARFGDGKDRLEEGKIMSELAKLVDNPNDCFIVEQLLFLEEQAKIS